MMDDYEARRLRWHCRRGMKEVEGLLLKYLDATGEQWDDAELAAFQALLRHSDNELFAWLTRQERAEDPRDQALVDRILDAVGAT